MLFNYTLKENILYGRLDASNEEIYRAAQQANALEFICPESQTAGESDLSQTFSDDNEVLQAGFLKFKEQMLKNIDQSIVARAKIATVSVEKVANVDDLSDQQKEEYERQKKLVEYLSMTEDQKGKVQEEEF